MTRASIAILEGGNMWVLIVIATIGFNGPSNVIAVQEFNTQSACYSAGIAIQQEVQTYDLTVSYTCTKD